MTTTRDGAGEDWDETDEIALDRPPAGNRHLLLGGAAGGFALALGGHFLPTTIEETEAREGALGGALGGRRGKNRRGRDKRKRRGHGDRKNRGKDQDQDKPPGDELEYKGIEFRFEVTGGRSVDINAFDFQELFPFSGWLPGNVKRIYAPGSSGTAHTVDRRAALRIEAPLDQGRQSPCSLSESGGAFRAWRRFQQGNI